jgi:hypothetical protein
MKPLKKNLFWKEVAGKRFAGSDLILKEKLLVLDSDLGSDPVL